MRLRCFRNNTAAGGSDESFCSDLLARAKRAAPLEYDRSFFLTFVNVYDWPIKIVSGAGGLKNFIVGTFE